MYENIHFPIFTRPFANGKFAFVDKKFNFVIIVFYTDCFFVDVFLFPFRVVSYLRKYLAHWFVVLGAFTKNQMVCKRVGMETRRFLFFVGNTIDDDEHFVQFESSIKAGKWDFL